MTQDTPYFNPFGFYAAAAEAVLEGALATQKTVIANLERASQADDTPLTWVPMPVPVVNSAFFFDEAAMRDSFHKAADQNLRGWELAAGMLQAMPTWAAWPTKVPGTVMTDVFDRMRRAGEAMMPANDRWATAAEAFGPASFWTTAEPATPTLLEGPDGEADDLTRIKGIGPKLSDLLNGLGVFHFNQIAEWTDTDGEWIDDQLAFKGRVAREKWIDQARALLNDSAAA